MPWWTERRIAFHERAQGESDFTRKLADIIEPYLTGTVAELGCGLGFMCAELHARGWTVEGYDSDSLAVEYALSHFPQCDFTLADAYTLNDVADTSIALFFGRITVGGNLEKMLTSCRKRLIYACSEHRASSECKWDEGRRTAAFLDKKGLKYMKLELSLSFDQPLRDRRELDEWIEENYTSRGRAFKRPVTRRDGTYPIAVLTDKAFTFFAIEKKEATL